MLKKVLMILMVIFMVSVMSAEKIFELPEIARPAAIKIKGDRLYILQKAEIFIYSLSDNKLIRKFGREGEGPREFNVNPFGAPMSLTISGDQLVVSSNNKVSYFSLEGEYIREHKAPPHRIFFPVNGGFLSVGMAGAEDGRYLLAMQLFDKTFQSVKTLHYTDIQVGNLPEILLPMCALTYTPVAGDKIILVGSNDDFVIDVLDKKGNKLYAIEKNYEKLPVTDEYKRETRHWFKDVSPLYKPLWERIKNTLKFREYYPAIKDFCVSGDRIYVITHKMERDQRECIVLDMKGKELKRVFVPMNEIEPFTYYPMLYGVEGGIYYTLLENEDDESWELHRKKIL